MITKEPIINVGLLTAPETEFILNGNFQCSNEEILSGKQTARFNDGKIEFSNRFYDTIEFIPKDYITDSFDLTDVVIGIDFHWERKETQRFKGALKLIVENGKITVINQIGVEDYLTSVISSEMSATASEELLKAHAVISRSWLLNDYRTRNLNPPQHELFVPSPSEISKSETLLLNGTNAMRTSNFDVCADDHCQRYQGITRSFDRSSTKSD
jgi:hypothetical protein